MRTALSVILSIALYGSIYSQSIDSLLVDVRLKDGASAKGRVIKQLPGPYAVLETTDGEQMVIGRGNAENIEIDREYLSDAIREELEKLNKTREASSFLETKRPVFSVKIGLSTPMKSFYVDPYLDEYSVSSLYIRGNYTQPVLVMEPEIKLVGPFRLYTGFSFTGESDLDDYTRIEEVRSIPGDTLVSYNRSGLKVTSTLNQLLVEAGIRFAPDWADQPVRPFVAIGLLKNIVWYSDEVEYTPPTVNPDYNTNKEDFLKDIYAFSGVAFSAGVEYDFNRFLSLFADYRMRKIWSSSTLRIRERSQTTYYSNGQYVWGNQFIERTTNFEYSRWIDQAQIGLSIHFW